MRKPAVVLAALALAAGAAQAQEAPMPLTLAGAVALAADTAPAVRLAELRTSEARQRVRQARSTLLPQVSAAASAVNRDANLKTFGLEFPSLPGQPGLPDRIAPYDVYDARMHVVAPLFDPAGRARIGASRALVASAEAERATAADAARTRAASAYLRAARAEATVRARREDLRLAEELGEIARAQLQRGVAAGIDVTRAQTQVIAVRGQVALARNAAAQAQVELARALGVDPATRFALADSLSAASQAPADPTAALAEALERRTELSAEAARLRAAEAAGRAVRAERLPRVDVAADYGFSGADPVEGLGTHTVAVQVSVPLWDGNRREARAAEQHAVVAEANVRAADLRAQIAAEVRAALLDVSSAVEQTAIAAERLSLAEAEVAQARERFSNGIAGNIEVINAQQSLLRARDAVIDARFAAAAAGVALAKATGQAATLR